MDKEDKIKVVFYSIQNSITKVHNSESLTYYGVLEALTNLVDLINSLSDTENIWYIGESTEFCLDDLIIGAYWHLTEWHDGQDSLSYSVMCLLGSIYTPMCEQPELDNFAYIILNQLAKDSYPNIVDG